MILFCMALSSVTESQEIGLARIRSAEQVITVGGPDADVPGFTSQAIQLALDAIKTRGGGIVKLNPGTYNVIGPVRLADNITLIGSGGVYYPEKM